MPRRRRRILSNRAYEICFRAVDTLPFVPYRVIKLLLICILARAQRDNKVELNHDIWNGSHVHMIVLAKDAEQCMKFYMEVKKKITDALKRLLGLKQLKLWEDNPSVIELHSLEVVQDRIAYLYANPGQDNLVESIEEFPGLSSWNDFQTCSASLNAETKETLPWIRLPSIPTLSSHAPGWQEDGRVTRLLKGCNKITHNLIRKPNSWMKHYGVTTDEECARVNAEIVDRVRAKEKAARERREEEKRSVMGRGKLLSQPILKPHTPKKKSRKIFLICANREARIRALMEFKAFCEECARCYRCWRRGELLVEWPPGAFRPPLPPAYNYLPG